VTVGAMGSLWEPHMRGAWGMGGMVQEVQGLQAVPYFMRYPWSACHNNHFGSDILWFQILSH
jgi:hypothetical protein